MMHSQLDAMLAESGFDPDDVEQLAVALAPMAELADEVPAPSAELLALFGGDAQDAATGAETARVVPIGRGRNRGVLAGALVLALSGVGATGLSAAANTLPSPLQHQVSDFSRHYLPFEFPQPTVRIPHLAPQPGTQQALEDAGGAVDPRSRAELLRNAEEISRSLTHARPGAKAAPAWSTHRGDTGARTANTSTYTMPRSSGPSASTSASPTPRSSSSTTAKPNTIKGGGSTYAPASPAKTPGPHSGGPQSGAPRGGKPTGAPPDGSGPPAKGGPVTDPGTDPVTPPENPPGTGVQLPDLPALGLPIEGGPVLDRVTPGSESDANDS